MKVIVRMCVTVCMRVLEGGWPLFTNAIRHLHSRAHRNGATRIHTWDVMRNYNFLKELNFHTASVKEWNVILWVTFEKPQTMHYMQTIGANWSQQNCSNLLNATDIHILFSLDSWIVGKKTLVYFYVSAQELTQFSAYYQNEIIFSLT